MTPADKSGVEEARAALAEQWPDYLVMDVSQPVVELAGEYADLYALRAYDAVQLATAGYLADKSSVAFACFDKRLNRAAETLGLQTT